MKRLPAVCEMDEGSLCETGRVGVGARAWLYGRKRGICVRKGESVSEKEGREGAAGGGSITLYESGQCLVYQVSCCVPVVSCCVCLLVGGWVGGWVGLGIGVCVYLYTRAISCTCCTTY